jgi:hypothetical protein
VPLLTGPILPAGGAMRVRRMRNASGPRSMYSQFISPPRICSICTR